MTTIDVLARSSLEPLGAPEDFGGDEFPCVAYVGKTHISRSPLMADVPGADTSNWSSDPRPAVTAYDGFDGDAYWLDGGVWRHCQTGEVWDAPVNLLDAVKARKC